MLDAVSTIFKPALAFFLLGLPLLIATIVARGFINLIWSAVNRSRRANAFRALSNICVLLRTYVKNVRDLQRPISIIR